MKSNASSSNNDKTLIGQLTVEEFRQLFLLTRKVDEKSKDEKKLIPRLDVARIFKVSLTTIDTWTKHSVLPVPIKMGSRVYYLKSAIEDLLTKKGGGHGTI
jgi:predicted DNA-binding transcriptional regulator AlpA